MENNQTTPQEIWLQWHGDGDPDIGDSISETDVTWSREKIYQADIKYIISKPNQTKQRKTII